MNLNLVYRSGALDVHSQWLMGSSLHSADQDQAQFEMKIRYPRGNVEYTVEYMSLDFRDKTGVEILMCDSSICGWDQSDGTEYDSAGSEHR